MRRSYPRRADEAIQELYMAFVACSGVDLAFGRRTSGLELHEMPLRKLLRSSSLCKSPGSAGGSASSRAIRSGKVMKNRCLGPSRHGIGRKSTPPRPFRRDSSIPSEVESTRKMEEYDGETQGAIRSYILRSFKALRLKFIKVAWDLERR